MPNNNPVFVFDGKLCKFEGMTKEQIINAIAQATGVTPSNVDEGFISTLVEQNKSKSVHFWFGSQAEYDALESYDSNTFYIIDGDATIDDLEASIHNVEEEIDEVCEDIQDIQGDVSNLQGRMTSVENAVTIHEDVSNWEPYISPVDGGLYLLCIKFPNQTPTANDIVCCAHIFLDDEGFIAETYSTVFVYATSYGNGTGMHAWWKVKAIPIMNDGVWSGAYSLRVVSEDGTIEPDSYLIKYERIGKYI